MNETLDLRYQAARERTRQIFQLLAPEAFDLRPIPLRHPIRFYEGHLASFNFGMLMRGGFVKDDPQPELTTLFARGIDPLSTDAADALTIRSWPERDVVHGYIRRVDDSMVDAFGSDVGRIYLHTALEHEEMHQETLMYLIHRLPQELKQKPSDARAERAQKNASSRWIRIAGDTVQLGLREGEAPFGWDNELPATTAEVAPFEIESAKVTNADFLEFVNDSGYENESFWDADAWQYLRENQINCPPFWVRRDDEWAYQGLFETMPLPLDWPVYVSLIEALAYTRWRGCRLPTEAEWQIADEQLRGAPDAQRDNFDFARWNPAPVDPSENAQLTGNGWEWTSTEFSGFPGFKPFAHYPGYSADFFDGRHFVLKGASPVTPAALVRPSFRNWFQDQYRHAYTGFRCAR